MITVKPATKRVGVLLLVIGGIFGVRHAMTTGLINRPSILKSLVPLKADAINAEVLADQTDVKSTGLPSDTVAHVSGPLQEVEVWLWQPVLGLLFANGGEHTTKGSLMEKYGVNVSIKRQDDTTQAQANLLLTAQALKNDPNASGTKFVIDMGDDGAQFFQGINPQLKKLGDEYQLETIAILGRSHGEDAFLGLPEWKTNPQLAKGSLIAGVLRSGDWNIVVDWANRNKIANNPDDTVYDPEAINWVNADTFIKAGERYIEGFCEDLPIKGTLKKTMKHVCVNGVASWTPVDVNIAHKRGGLVSILSTRENVFQMPCVLIGIKKWDNTHRKEIDNMLAAAFSGAAQVKAFPAAMQRGEEISAKVYHEGTADFWTKYYKGSDENDVQGLPVHLGGSYTGGLADNIQEFGMNPGSPNLYAATYNTFGRIVKQQYPNLVPDYPSVASITNTSFVQDVRNMNTNMSTTVETKSYNNAPLKEIVGKRNYNIEFRTGSDEILPESFSTLNDVADDVMMTNLAIVLNGYTDSSGSPDTNMLLSKQRAEAVKSFLQKKSPSTFSDGRIRVFAHGSENPIADNSTREGMAKNRRVQIVLGTTE